LLGVVPAVALIAIAGWSVMRTVFAERGVPGDAAWTAAADHVRAGAQPGDLIVFAPAWIDPVGRMHLGDRIPVEMAARLDAATYPAIWELSIRGAHAPEVAGLTADTTTRIGGITVRRYRQAARTVVTDLTAAFATARVDGARARGPDRVIAEVGFTPRRCVQIVPAADGEVRLTVADVELGTELAIGVGLADIFTRRDVRNPGELAVAVDGFEVIRVRFGVDDGWVRRTAATRPGRATVTVTARAVGLGATNRLVCFAAEARR
jgi:hypothetical protein